MTEKIPPQTVSQRKEGLPLSSKLKLPQVKKLKSLRCLPAKQTYSHQWNNSSVQTRAKRGCHGQLPAHVWWQGTGQCARPSATSDIHTRAHPGAADCVRAETSTAVFRLGSGHVPVSDSNLCHLEPQCQSVKSKNTAALLWMQPLIKPLL